MIEYLCKFELNYISIYDVYEISSIKDISRETWIKSSRTSQTLTI